MAAAAEVPETQVANMIAGEEEEEEEEEEREEQEEHVRTRSKCRLFIPYLPHLVLHAAFNLMKSQMTKVARAMTPEKGGLRPDPKAMAEIMSGAGAGGKTSLPSSAVYRLMLKLKNSIPPNPSTSISPISYWLSIVMVVIGERLLEGEGWGVLKVSTF